MAETSYGDDRRFAFLAEIIARQRPTRILDIGCGTGTGLTRPLAEAFPASRFIGTDADRESIAWAQRNQRDCANLAFCLPEELAASEHFDLILASEVIEHVADPAGFLAAQRARLDDGGRLVLTLPNGYGPFELMAL